MSLLAPGLQSHLWPTPIFILVHWQGVIINPFSLDQGVRIMPFWIRLLLTLNKDWTPSSLIHLRHLNWTLPWRELDAITSSSVSSGFLHSVSTLSDNSKPQLAPSICTHKLWCQARALLAPVSLATKMSASKLIHYFSSHPAAFGFWASTPPDNISLNSANRKGDQSLSDFQTGVGAAAHSTLDTEQLISCLWVALVDTLSSLPEAEGDIIPVSEVCELLLWICGILDKAVSK